ncbi:MAG: hypothetical protein P1V20_08310 [Verrucomicrobiales bacterium]|nr:hypothetical protein [Verrucomicrobiales bacterium]
MCSRFAGFLVLVFLQSLSSQEIDSYDYWNLDAPEHSYWTRDLHDPFTAIKDELESGRLPLDFSSEKAFVTSLLQHLRIPVSSQTLVFSTTSLQLSLISPRSPRALYFNEEIYVGYVPGGKIEIISMDPELGGIFYIFDIPKRGRTIEIQRSQRCMNCHSDEDTRDSPGLVIKSVIPGQRGGSLDSYRRHETGHQIPFHERFGGWYVTGGENLGSHHGNVIGNFSKEGIVTRPVEPGHTFDWSIFPVQTSDALAHLLHEHQAGFVNRVLETHYLARGWLKQGNGQMLSRHETDLDAQVDLLVRYLLYADEAEFPAGEISGDAQFKTEFRANRLTSSDGKSLKDFDLKNRMFRFRCSYMIYSPVFRKLPPMVKDAVYQKMEKILSAGRESDKTFAYLPHDERKSIREILRQTHPDLSHW